MPMAFASGGILFELFSVIGGQAGALGNLAGAALAKSTMGENDPNKAFNTLISDLTYNALNPGSPTPPEVPNQTTLAKLLNPTTGPNNTKSKYDNLPDATKKQLLGNGTLEELKRTHPALFFEDKFFQTTEKAPYTGWGPSDDTIISNKDQNLKMYNFFSDKLKGFGVKNDAESGAMSFSYNPADTSPTEVRIAKETRSKLNTVYAQYRNYVENQQGGSNVYKSVEEEYNALNPAPPTQEELDAIKIQTDLDLALQERKAQIAFEQKNLDTIMMNQLNRTRKKNISLGNNNTILGPLT